MRQTKTHVIICSLQRLRPGLEMSDGVQVHWSELDITARRDRHQRHRPVTKDSVSNWERMGNFIAKMHLLRSIFKPRIYRTANCRFNASSAWFIVGLDGFWLLTKMEDNERLHLVTANISRTSIKKFLTGENGIDLWSLKSAHCKPWQATSDPDATWIWTAWEYLDLQIGFYWDYVMHTSSSFWSKCMQFSCTLW